MRDLYELYTEYFGGGTSTNVVQEGDGVDVEMGDEDGGDTL